MSRLYARVRPCPQGNSGWRLPPGELHLPAATESERFSVLDFDDDHGQETHSQFIVRIPTLLGRRSPGEVIAVWSLTKVLSNVDGALLCTR
jgi:hypothetical protein